MQWRCPVCKKEFENFSIRDFTICPKTTLYGDFKIRDINGNIEKVNRKINKSVCSEECKQKNESQYFIEEYKGNNIYCVDGKYMPYLESVYWYDSIEDVKNRIDSPQLIPATPTLLRGLGVAMRGEPGNI